MSDFPEFENFLAEKVQEYGAPARRLSEDTGIPLHYLESLVRGEFERLPAAPYVRGYLRKLGEVLEFDPEPWWSEIRRREIITESGLRDRLPLNRFAPPRIARLAIWGAAALGALLIISFVLSAIFRKPAITLTSPTEDTMTATETPMLIAGVVRGASTVSISGTIIPATPDGVFRENIPLEPGLNTIQIIATRFLGRSTTVSRQIFYEPVKTANPTPSSTPPTR